MRRIIAYIYNYKSEGSTLHKCDVAGFCRVEINGDKCEVNLRLKDGCGVEGMAHIYMLKKIRDASVCKCQYHKEKNDRCYEMCAGVLNGKLCMDNKDGICVECGGRTYVAFWSECPENIQLVECKDNSADEANRHRQGDTLENKAENKMEDKIKNKVENRVENKKKDKIEVVRENKMVNKSVEDCFQGYTRIYNRLCKIRIILNGVEYPAVKMKPQEMIMLPRNCWRLANNIFLMESYYRYRHILFMKYEGRYVIAVPWGKCDEHNRYSGTAIRAKRFGFEQCVTGYEYGKAREEKNYWIMNLE